MRFIMDITTTAAVAGAIIALISLIISIILLMKINKVYDYMAKEEA